MDRPTATDSMAISLPNLDSDSGQGNLGSPVEDELNFRATLYKTLGV